MAPRPEEHGARGHVISPAASDSAFGVFQLENESLSVFLPYDLHGVAVDLALQVGPMIPRQNFAPTFQQALSLFEFYSSNPGTSNILLWPFSFLLPI